MAAARAPAAKVTVRVDMAFLRGYYPVRRKAHEKPDTFHPSIFLLPWRLVWSARRWSRLFSAGVKGRCGVHLVDSNDTDSAKTSLTTSAPSMRNLATEASDRRFS